MQKFIQMTVYGFLMLALPLLLASPSEAAKTTKKTPVKSKSVAHQNAKPVKKPVVTAKIAAKPVMSKKPVITTKVIATKTVAPKKMDLAAMPTKAVAAEVAERRTRIDFEDLLIQGQLKKADTVYLFERGENQLRSLVKKKENFREEIYQNYLN